MRGTELESDFIVAPGADPNEIRLELVGEGSALPRAAAGRPYQIAPNSDLVIMTAAGEVRFHRPVVYQPVAATFRSPSGGLKPAATVASLYERRDLNGGHRLPLQSNPQSQIQNRESLEGRYTLVAKNQIAFELGPYDRNLPLIIDPVLIYSTYLGDTNGESSNAIAVDSSGNVYVAGSTSSIDFPTKSSLQEN